MNSKLEIIQDELLENVSGGEFGDGEHVTKITAANYKSFIRSAINVVVLYGVSWSNTCVRASEIIEDCAVKYNRIRVGVFDVTDCELIVYKLGITSVPTTIRYKFGIEVYRTEGLHRITNSFKNFKLLNTLE